MNRAPRCLYCIHYSVYNRGLPGIFCTCGRFRDLPESNGNGRRGFFIKYIKSTQQNDEILMPVKFNHPSYTKSERDWSHIKNTHEVKSKMRGQIGQRASLRLGEITSEIPKQIIGKRILENRGNDDRGLEVKKKLKVEEGLKEKFMKNMKLKEKAKESSLGSLKKNSIEKDEKKQKLKSKDLMMELLIEDVTLSEC